MNSESLQMQPVADSPERLPSAWANDAPLEPAQYQWIEMGKWHEHEVTDETKVPLTTVPARKDVSLRIDASALPSELKVGVYSELDERGLPRYEQGERIDCLTDKRCQVSADGKSIIIGLNGIDDAKVLVLYVGYLILSEQEKGPSKVVMMSASWAMRVS